MKFEQGPYSIIVQTDPYKTFNCQYAIILNKYVERGGINYEWDQLIGYMDVEGYSGIYPTLNLNIKEWLDACIGPKNWAQPNLMYLVKLWKNGPTTLTITYPIGFRRKRDAMLFKLTWS